MWQNDSNRQSSSQWTGYLKEGAPGEQRRLDLMMHFNDGRLSGIGNLENDICILEGRFDSEEGEFEWTQKLLSGSILRFRGFQEGKSIWGTWQSDTDRRRGGFLIWPLSVVQTDPIPSGATPASAVTPSRSNPS